jgi:predicted DNA-binding transcriptional regulator AlpA
MVSSSCRTQKPSRTRDNLEPLLESETVATLLGVPQSWVYANADEIPGVLRLGRYVRFRSAIIHLFLAGSEVVQ